VKVAAAMEMKALVACRYYPLHMLCIVHSSRCGHSPTHYLWFFQSAICGVCTRTRTLLLTAMLDTCAVMVTCVYLPRITCSEWKQRCPYSQRRSQSIEHSLPSNWRVSICIIRHGYGLLLRRHFLKIGCLILVVLAGVPSAHSQRGDT
jgi:hypothetical protein